MMRIAVLGDTHFGIRNDSLAFHKYAEKFYEKVFFPYLKDHNIESVIQVGDLFDRRKFINFQSFYLSKMYFFEEFYGERKLYTLLGNHDIYFKNSLDVNSIELCLEHEIDRGRVKCFTEPTTVIFDGVPID